MKQIYTSCYNLSALIMILFWSLISISGFTMLIIFYSTPHYESYNCATKNCSCTKLESNICVEYDVTFNYWRKVDNKFDVKELTTSKNICPPGQYSCWLKGNAEMELYLPSSLLYEFAKWFIVYGTILTTCVSISSTLTSYAINYININSDLK